MPKPKFQTFDVEAYWGTEDGTLMHGTITVRARSMSEALDLAREDRLIPDNSDHWEMACARPEYFEDHYDVEPIGDEYDDIRALENHRAFITALGANYGTAAHPPPP